MSINQQIQEEIHQLLLMPPSSLKVGETTEEKLDFYAFYKPTIYAGSYTVDLAHTIKIPDVEPPETLGKQTIKLRVGSYRFTIPKQEIHTVYPPRNTYGDYETIVPHITLNRDTLPWERKFNKTDQEKPWLALLIFREEEMVDIKIETVDPKTISYILPEPDVELPDFIRIIDFTEYEKKHGGAFKYKPENSELQMLTHRLEHTDTQNNKTEKVVLLGNRLPEAGKKSIVHLVSLEYGWKTKMISLYNWEFTGSDGKKSFESLKDITVGDLTIKTPNGSDQPQLKGATQLKKGFVPLVHHIKDGTKTVSWFHGPIIPKFKNGDRPTIQRKTPLYAEDFLQFDTKSTSGNKNMLDVSYAAAWNLGRLLTLQKKEVALDLFRYKQRRAQYLKTQAVLAKSDLPVISLIDDPALPVSVQQWLEDLLLLKPVPINYLLAHPTMLPAESLQFFRLDLNWIYHLQLGAMSVGEAWAAPEQLANPPITWIDRNKDYDYYSGFLLRSQVVADYPDIQIEGSHGNDVLTTIALRRLDAQTLFVLFKGDNLLTKVKCYKSGKALHYGFTKSEDNFIKKLKKADDESFSETITLSTAELDAKTGKLNVNKLWAKLKKDHQEELTAPADFGFKMTEVYPAYTFTDA